MTNVLESLQLHTDPIEVIDNLDLESPEGKDHARIIGTAIAGRTIQLNLSHDNSFSQSKTPDTFTD